MSTPTEKIAAQKDAFNSETQHRHRHLIGPVELECLLRDHARLQDFLRAQTKQQTDKTEKPTK